MPDRLLLASLDVPKGFFQKACQRQQILPRRWRIRTAYQLPEFCDRPMQMCSVSGQTFLTLRRRYLPPRICFQNVSHRAAQDQFAMVEPNGVIA